jgi:hypothetical protein
MQCHQCGTEILFNDGKFCSNCGAFLSDTHEDQTHRNGPSLAWESTLIEEEPFSALFKTISAVLMQPKKTLTYIAEKPNSSRHALLYGLIIGGIGMIASWGWSAFFARCMSASQLKTMLLNQGLYSPVVLTLAPVLLVTQFFFLTLYVVVLMKIFHRNEISFKQTLRMICYAETPVVLHLVPLFGALAAAFMWIYTLLTGIHLLYGISRIKLVMVLSLPAVSVLFIIAVIFIAAMTGGIAAGTGMLPQLPPIFR